MSDRAIVKVPSGTLILHHAKNALSAKRANRYYYDAAGLQLLQQGRRNVVDAAGHDDLVDQRNRSAKTLSQ
jgi:hypothetical protein